MRLSNKIILSVLLVGFSVLLPASNVLGDGDPTPDEVSRPIVSGTMNCKTILTASGDSADPIAQGVCKIYRLAILFVWILMAAAFGYFVLGVIKYMTAAGSEDAASAKQIMLYGLLGLAVIYGSWALITFGIEYFTGVDLAQGNFTGPFEYF